ncbi:MAG TPA: COX15/CtaA family protein [Planctomycetota bacterium]|nr:COX15/CtaA family protein [Planctomycetota bacterium]
MNDTVSTPFPALRYNRGLHWMAIFTTAWTFLVVVVGGTVKSNEAGLSIPEPFIITIVKDWSEGNRIYEFVHRALVGVLGISVALLVIWIWMAETRRSVKKFSLLLIVSVLLQAVVGWMTVRFLAHAQTSIPHAALGQSFLAMMAGITTVLSARWMSSTPAINEQATPSLRRLALYNVIAVFVQMLLGAALRHDDHGKAFFAGREWVFHLHLGAHVLGAIAVGYFMARVLFRVFHGHRQTPEIIKPARWIMMLFTLQLLLGIAAAVLKIFTLKDPDLAEFYADVPPPARVWTATAHVVVGAAILAISTLILVRSYRYALPKAVAAKNDSREAAVGTGVSV